MTALTVRQIEDARRAAYGHGPPGLATAARAWLAGCPWIESAYVSHEAWYLAQQAAKPFRIGAQSGAVVQA